MKKTVLYLEIEQVAALKKLSAKTGRSMSNLVRIGIDLAIKKFSKRRS